MMETDPSSSFPLSHHSSFTIQIWHDHLQNNVVSRVTATKWSTQQWKWGNVCEFNNLCGDLSVDSNWWSLDSPCWLLHNTSDIYGKSDLKGGVENDTRTWQKWYSQTWSVVWARSVWVWELFSVLMWWNSFCSVSGWNLKHCYWLYV